MRERFDQLVRWDEKMFRCARVMRGISSGCWMDSEEVFGDFCDFGSRFLVASSRFLGGFFLYFCWLLHGFFSSEDLST
jgi:hypothetical protein